MGDMMTKVAMSKIAGQIMSGSDEASSLRDLVDGGGFGQSGDQFAGRPISGVLNGMGISPMQQQPQQQQQQPVVSTRNHRPRTTTQAEPPAAPMQAPSPIQTRSLPPMLAFGADGSIPARGESGLPMLDNSGTITRGGEPQMSAAEWEQLQAAMRAAGL